jgi:hypothetical protein
VNRGPAVLHAMAYYKSVSAENRINGFTCSHPLSRITVLDLCERSICLIDSHVGTNLGMAIYSGVQHQQHAQAAPQQQAYKGPTPPISLDEATPHELQLTECEPPH